MSMGPGAGGPPWRHLRSDRSVVDNKIERRTVRRVLEFARPHRRLITAFLGVTVVDAALVVAPPLLLKMIIDDGVSSGDTSLVVWLAVLVAIVAVVDSAFGLITGWLSSRIGEGLIYDLRTQVFAHVQRQSLAFFTRTQTGALVSRLNNDVIGAQRAFTSTLQGTVSNIIAAVVVGVTMLFLSWPVTVLCLALFPILLIASRLVGARLADLSRAQMDGNADLGNAMTERFNVGGAMLLKLFGRREAEDVAYAQKAAVVRDLGIRISLLTRIFFAAMTLVPSLATALVYGIGGWLAIRGDLSVGTIVALGVLLTRLLGPLQGLSNVRIDVMTALVSFDRVFEVLDLPVADPGEARRRRAAEHGIVAGVRPRRLHLPARRPDLAGLARDGGAHRVARLRAGAPRRDLHGPARADGRAGRPFRSRQDHRHAPRRPSLRRRVRRGPGRRPRRAGRDAAVARGRGRLRHPGRAHVPRHHPRQPALRPSRRRRGGRLGCAGGRADRGLVRSLPDGLDTVVGDRGYRLSGGERQRLAIARLLLKAPSIVVLDEATAHLDSESEAAVQQALDAALEGRTSLVIAHRLSTVRNADLILVLDDGRVVQQGTHADLLAAGGLYATLHATQFREASQPHPSPV